MKKNFILRVAAILLVLTMFSISIVTGRLAKYVTTASGDDSARVAKFELTETGLQEDAFYVHIAPGETPVHTITVINSSEVAMRYTVQLENMTNNLPDLKFVMTGKNNGGQIVGSYNDAIRTYSGDLPANAGEDGKITIHVQTAWNSTDPAHAEKVDWVRILVTAEQID